MSNNTISNLSDKEKHYLNFEQQFKAWRESFSLPAFDHYMEVHYEEADNLALFYDAFQYQFDELVLRVFNGNLDEAEQQILYQQMDLKYGAEGVALPPDLDSEFQLKYHPQEWALKTIQRTIFTDEGLKADIIARLEYPDYDHSILCEAVQQEAWAMFYFNFTQEFGRHGPSDWKDRDFKAKFHYAVRKFIHRTLQETKISYHQHMRTAIMLTNQIEAAQKSVNRLLKGSFLTHALMVEDKIASWVKENAIAMDEWETVDLEKLKAYTTGFNDLFNGLINQWCEANQINRNHEDFDQKINELYDRLKTKHRLDVMMEISEARQNIARQWQKLRTVIKAITPKKAVVTFIGG